MNEVVEKPTTFSLLPDLSGKKVPDLGGGTGTHLAHYLKCGAAKEAGPVLSELMLRQAETELSRD